MAFRDMVLADLGAQTMQSFSAPPGPVEGPVDLAVPPSNQVEGVLGKIKQGLKVAAYPLTFTLEGLTRFEDVVQAGFLTATGKIPLDQFDDYVGDIVHGRRRVSGRDMIDLLVGKEFRYALDKIPIIPGWVKEVTDPQSPFYGEKLPRANLGSLLDFFTEATISPYAAVSMLPRSLVAATKLDVVTRAVTLPLTMPLKLAGRAVFSPEHPLGFLLMRARDPDAVLPPALANTLKLNSKSIEDLAVKWGEVFKRLDKTHGLQQNWLTRVMGRPTAINSAKLWTHMGHHNVALTAAEETARKAIVDDVLTPLKQTMLQAQPTYGGGRKVLPGLGVIAKWDPDKEMLRPFVVLPKNYSLVPAEIGGKEFIQRVTVGVPVRQKKLPYRLNQVKEGNRDIMHAISWFTGQMEKARILHGPTGALSLYGPRVAQQGARANPLSLQNLSQQQWLYWLEKVHSITGHASTKPTIMMNILGERMWNTVKTRLEDAGQRNRIIGLWQDRFGLGPFGDPRLGRTNSIVSVLVARQMTALLGGQLSSPLKNTSQALNTAAIKGVPALISGIFKSVDRWSEEGRLFGALRRRVNFGNETSKLAHDNMWAAAGTTMDRILMSPFNASESVIRGWAFNIRAAEELEKRGIKTLAQWRGLPAREKSKIIAGGFLDAQMTNFTYGMAGRSALMMHPVARVGFALQSYSWKQLEFTARLFREDGLAFTRLLALHGWAIETANHAAGINAESWLGWGFLPPNGKFGEGPAVETFTNLMGLVLATNEDDPKQVSIQIDRVRGGIRELFRAFGDPDAHLGLQAGLGAAATFGLLPIPIVAIGKTSRAVNEFLTGQREAAGGRTWRPVTREEALKSYFMQTHEQAEQNRLRRAEAKVRRKYDGEMRNRVNKFVNALQRRDGDAVRESAARMYDKITFKVPLTAQKHPGALGGDEREFYPTLNMVESRLKEEVRRRTVGQGVRSMVDSGWAIHVLTAEYINAALRDIELGATRALK